MEPSSAERLHGWVASVRDKFHIGERSFVPAGTYWDGYAACLEDVDRLADRWAADPGPVAPSRSDVSRDPTGPTAQAIGANTSA